MVRGRGVSTTREDEHPPAVEPPAADGNAGDASAADATTTTATAAAVLTVQAGKKGNKKPKQPCGKCSEETNGTMSVYCQTCDFWFHYGCIDGMNKEYFENCKLTYDLHGYSAFLCQVCRKVVAKFNKKVKSLEEKVEEMGRRVETLEKENERMARRLELNETKVAKVGQGLEGVEKEVVNGMEKAKEEVKKDMSREMQEREERSQNVVLYGLEEPAAEEAEERRREEKEKVDDVIRKLDVTVTGAVEVQFRAGRKGEEPLTKPRPLIIKVTDDETREKIHKNARRLSQVPEYRRVFIAQDLTWAQREEGRKIERELREEAERKTAEAAAQGKRGKFLVVGQRGRRRLVWTDRVD